MYFTQDSKCVWAFFLYSTIDFESQFAFFLYWTHDSKNRITSLLEWSLYFILWFVSPGYNQWIPCFDLLLYCIDFCCRNLMLYFYITLHELVRPVSFCYLLSPTLHLKVGDVWELRFLKLFNWVDCSISWKSGVCIFWHVWRLEIMNIKIKVSFLFFYDKKNIYT